MKYEDYSNLSPCPTPSPKKRKVSTTKSAQVKSEDGLDGYEPVKKNQSKQPASHRKWTDDDIRLLCQLKESRLGWEEIADKYFPGYSPGTLANKWSKMRQCVNEEFTAEKDNALRKAVENFDKKKWDLLGKEIGMSPEGCKRRVKELGLKWI